MSDQVLSIKLKKKDGKLVPASDLELERYRIFLKQLKEDALVDAVMELKTMSNTKAQLAKIHVMIKAIADEQGDTVSAVKKNVKRECGLSYHEKGKEIFQSFADCSKQELSNVIESIIQMGRFLNINLEGLS
jgi:hypothetical protein